MNKNKKIPYILENLLNGDDLDDITSKHLMLSWLNNDIPPEQTGAILAAFRAKKVNGNELASMAEVLINACKLPLSRPDHFLVDTCGTGGDGANTFNISTAVAFVSAACGVKVAKHGNKSASGNVGSADVLSNLGINLDSSLDNVISAISDVGVSFLFAPAWHKSLINLAPIRKSLGIRTIFNQLGPLVNPLRPDAQVLGVATEDLLEPMSEALKKLGMKRAIVVNGFGGLDEASLQGRNKLVYVEQGKLRYDSIDIKDFGLENSNNIELTVGEDSNNQDIFESVLKGNGKASHLNVVALNTALVLWAAGIEFNLKDGFQNSMRCIKSGESWIKFKKLRDYL